MTRAGTGSWVSSWTLLAAPLVALQVAGGGGQTAPAEPPPLRLAPVAGLTTAWHDAPEAFAVPLGTLVTLKQPLMSGAQATWTGVDAVRADEDASIATCLMDSLGLHVVEVVVEAEPASLSVPGVTSFAQSVELAVVNVPVEAIDVAPIQVDTASPVIDATTPNATLVELFFGPSIAPVAPREEGGWVTSVNRPVAFSTRAGPAALRPAVDFGPLVEWRVDGEPVALGSAYELSLAAPGEVAIEAGPPDRAPSTVVEAYAVTIVEQPAAIAAQAATGEPLAFTAVTDPPGFEPMLNWLAATKYGSAMPVTGHGPRFVTVFANSVSARPSASISQWVGVKVGDAALGGDGGGGGPPPPAPDAPVPDNGGEGTFVTITGEDFPADPSLDTCVMLGPNANLFVDTSSNETLIVGEVQLVPPGAQAGPVRVMTGTGTILEPGDFVPVPGIVYGQGRLFEGTGEPQTIGETNVPFTPAPTPGALGYTLSPADSGVGLKATMTVTSAVAGQCAQMWALLERQNGTSDLHMCEIQITQNLSANQVAVFLCSTLLSAFGSIPGFTCLVVGAGDTIEISLPVGNGLIDWQGGVLITTCTGANDCAGP